MIAVDFLHGAPSDRISRNMSDNNGYDINFALFRMHKLQVDIPGGDENVATMVVLVSSLIGKTTQSS
jgi:hypothetical protein